MRGRLVLGARKAARSLADQAAESVIWAAARIAGSDHGEQVRSILVLRNNDLGDLLVATPLFDALRRRFPAARIAAAVGRWNLPALAGNPHVSEILIVEAPWFNKFVRPQSVWRRLRYLLRSPEVEALRRRRFDVGIDVLGSRWGAALLLRAKIPYRLGVRGFAGGHTAAQRLVRFDPGEHVGRSALRFAELLGATELPDSRPQIFLTAQEKAAGEMAWRSLAPLASRRILVAPGSGLAIKSWPPASYAALVSRLCEAAAVAVAIAGGPGDRSLGERLAGGVNLAGHLSLRETFALVAAADLVVCNSSVLMHAAAAFEKPTVVLLGASFPSARQHQAQWGYAGTSVSLGRETGERESLATLEEALAAIDLLAYRQASLPVRRSEAP